MQIFFCYLFLGSFVVEDRVEIHLRVKWLYQVDNHVVFSICSYEMFSTEEQSVLTLSALQLHLVVVFFILSSCTSHVCWEKSYSNLVVYSNHVVGLNQT